MCINPIAKTRKYCFKRIPLTPKQYDRRIPQDGRQLLAFPVWDAFGDVSRLTPSTVTIGSPALNKQLLPVR